MYFYASVIYFTVCVYVCLLCELVGCISMDSGADGTR